MIWVLCVCMSSSMLMGKIQATETEGSGSQEPPISETTGDEKTEESEETTEKEDSREESEKTVETEEVQDNKETESSEPETVEETEQADEGTTEIEENPLYIDESVPESVKGYEENIVGEIVDKREANAKHFLMEDGTIYRVDSSL